MMQTVNFKLSETQQKKIARAHKMRSSVILRLNKGQKHPGGTPLLLTEQEIATLGDGNSHDITFSYSRIKKTGGIIPLLPILGAAGALTGIITGIVNSVKNSRTASAQNDAARAAEELAKFRLANERKNGSGLKFKCRK